MEEAERFIASLSSGCAAAWGYSCSMRLAASLGDPFLTDEKANIVKSVFDPDGGWPPQWLSSMHYGYLGRKRLSTTRAVVSFAACYDNMTRIASTKIFTDGGVVGGRQSARLFVCTAIGV
jgi:hypothetical protein